MEAVVLAGGQIPTALLPVTDATERALIELEGQTLLELVLNSLRETAAISDIICVTTPIALQSLPSDVRGLASGEKLTENLFKGARAAKGNQILVVTGDVPLASSQTWTQFLEAASQRSLDAAYPIVSKADCQAQFPAGKRTYATLKDGTFTGGNAFLLPRDRLESLETLFTSAFAARKNPLALAKMLGMGFILRGLTKKLTIAEVETKISGLIGAKSGAVPVSDAAIAFDIDKPQDLEVATQTMKSRARDAHSR